MQQNIGMCFVILPVLVQEKSLLWFKKYVSPQKRTENVFFFYSESDFPLYKQKHDLLLGVVYPFKMQALVLTCTSTFCNWFPDGFVACPRACTCTEFVPLNNGSTTPSHITYRVICNPGQRSLPYGLGSETRALVLRGSYVGGSSISTIGKSDLRSLGQLEELAIPFANLASIGEQEHFTIFNMKISINHNHATVIVIVYQNYLKFST